MINIQSIVNSTIRDINLILKSHSASKKDLKLKSALYSGVGNSDFSELKSLMMVKVYGILLFDKKFFLDFGDSMEDKEYEYLKGKTAIQKSNNKVYLHIGKVEINNDGSLGIFENFAKATIKKMLELGYQYNKDEGLIKENKMKIRKSYLKKIIEEVLLETQRDLSGDDKSAAGWFHKHHEEIDKLYKEDKQNFVKNAIEYFKKNMPIGRGISQKWFDNMISKIEHKKPDDALLYCYNFYLKGSGKGLT